MEIIIFGFMIQFYSFISFYIIWRKDCKEIAKENLVADLLDRFLIWMIHFPAWWIGIVDYFYD